MATALEILPFDAVPVPLSLSLCHSVPSPFQLSLSHTRYYLWAFPAAASAVAVASWEAKHTKKLNKQRYEGGEEGGGRGSRGEDDGKAGRNSKVQGMLTCTVLWKRIIRQEFSLSLHFNLHFSQRGNINRQKYAWIDNAEDFRDKQNKKRNKKTFNIFFFPMQFIFSKASL